MPENQNNTSNEPPKKKRFTWWKISLAVLALVIALFALKVVLILTAKPTISVDYVAELNRLSKPPNYDPNHDAAADYQKAIELAVDLHDQLTDIYTQWPEDISAKDLTQLNQWTNANQQTLGLVKIAAAKPYYWARLSAAEDSLYSIEPDPFCRAARQLCILLRCCAMLRALEGDFDAAFSDIMTQYRIAAHLSAQKATIHQMSSVVLRIFATRQALGILANNQIDSASLKSFHRQLESVISRSPTEMDFLEYRLYALDAIQRMFTDDGSGDGHLAFTEMTRQFVRQDISNRSSRRSGSYRRILGPLFRSDRREPTELSVNIQTLRRALFGPHRKQTMLAVEEYFKRLDVLKAQKLRKLRPMGRDPNRQLPGPEAGRILAWHYMVSAFRLIELHRRAKAEQTALVTTLAVLRHRTDKDSFPESLDQLVQADYLKHLPMDPYGDGPLVYKNLADDFTLYSLGADFDDDAGVPSLWGDGPDGGDQVFWPPQEQSRIPMPR